jgi:uncharacterized protein (TIGR04255 family)
MLFPEMRRFIYHRNPLDLVRCTLRFPPILKIARDSPVEFQEKIRDRFPNYQEASTVTMELPFAPPGIARIEVGQFVESQSTVHQFISEDEGWKITLSRDSLSLLTRKYERWEEFKDKLEAAFQALNVIYNPNYFSRASLQYVDVFDRLKLGLENDPWTDLLQPYILGVMSAAVPDESIRRFDAQYEFDFDADHGRVKIRTFYGKYPDRSGRTFVVDSFFQFMGKLAPDLVLGRLDFFHEQASRLIRWCITDDLHEKLEPEEI